VASITEQYRIITNGAGWSSHSNLGRIHFEGTDRISFLQGLLTNDVATLAPGRGVYAAYLTPHGRMLADIILVDRGDAVLGLVGEGQGPALATRFDQLIFAEDVRVTDVTGQFDEVFVTGAEASRAVAAVTGLGTESLAALPELGSLPFGEGVVLRDGASSLPAFRIVADVAVGATIRKELADRAVVELEPELVTALRIEAGRARWGNDLGDDVIPLEAGLLDRGISTTKGCYVGQEIVIRILHRGGGRVAKRLAVLAFEPSGETAPRPEVGSAIRSDGANTAGRLTSVAFSPARGAVVAFGYLPREAAEIGRVVTVAGSGATATVVDFAR
jgi:folate-binding protein YgfZ